MSRECPKGGGGGGGGRGCFKVNQSKFWLNFPSTKKNFCSAVKKAICQESVQLQVRVKEEEIENVLR